MVTELEMMEEITLLRHHAALRDQQSKDQYLIEWQLRERVKQLEKVVGELRDEIDDLEQELYLYSAQ